MKKKHYYVTCRSQFHWMFLCTNLKDITRINESCTFVKNIPSSMMDSISSLISFLPARKQACCKHNSTNDCAALSAEVDIVAGILAGDSQWNKTCIAAAIRNEVIVNYYNWLLFNSLILFLIHHAACVCYDDACHLKKYACNPSRKNTTTTSSRLASLNIAVDKLHFRGHVDPWCHQNCDLYKFDELKEVNSYVWFG